MSAKHYKATVTILPTESAAARRPAELTLLIKTDRPEDEVFDLAYLKAQTLLAKDVVITAVRLDEVAVGKPVSEEGDAFLRTTNAVDDVFAATRAGVATEGHFPRGVPPGVPALTCSRCGCSVHHSWDHLDVGEHGERWTCDARASERRSA